MRPTPKLTLVFTLAVGLLAFTAATAPRASVAFAAARTGSPPVASSAAARMNIVFIVSDDERVNGNAVMKDVQRLIAQAWRDVHELSRHDVGVRSLAREHPHRALRPPQRGHRQLRAS